MRIKTRIAILLLVVATCVAALRMWHMHRPVATISFLRFETVDGQRKALLQISNSGSARISFKSGGPDFTDYNLQPEGPDGEYADIHHGAGMPGDILLTRLETASFRVRPLEGASAWRAGVEVTEVRLIDSLPLWIWTRLPESMRSRNMIEVWSPYIQNAR